MRWGALVPALLLAGAARADPVPEAARKSLNAVRTDKPPHIDGRLDDAAWAAAPPDDRFTQAFPAEGRPPSERIELRVLYDDDALYVGVRMHDAHPEQIVARLTRRDRIPEADAVVLRIDSQHDHSTAYAFRLHASGVQADNLSYDDGNGSSPEWDAVWSGEVAIDAEGWSAEYRIPLSVLRFAGRPDETWGLQVLRYVSRTGEQDVWSFWPSNQRGEASHYDHLVGLHDLRPRRTFDLRPYLLGRLRGETPEGVHFLGLGTDRSPGRDYDAGLDLKLGLTSDLTLDLSANPDFGQVEADQVVLNLSRFETFFPEKRPFFLEGTDILHTPIQLFYSRRIGRPQTGFRPGRTIVVGADTLTIREAPGSLRIWGAGKLSGKLGRSFSLGVLSAVTDTETVLAGNSQGTAQGGREVVLAPMRGYNVLRTKLGLGGPSYLGLMATGVTRMNGNLYRAIDDHDAYAASADGLWQSSGAEWRLVGQGLATKRVGGNVYATPAGTPCPDAADRSCVAVVRSDGTPLLPGAFGYGGTARLSHAGAYDLEEIAGDLLSPDLDPNDAGFLPDFNKQQVMAKVGFQDRRPGDTFQSLGLAVNQTVARDFDGNQIGNRTGLDGNGLFKNLSFLNPGVGYYWPGSWDIRETLDGGRFEQRPRFEAYVYASSDARRSVLADVSLLYARTISEHMQSFSASGSLVMRPLPPLELTFSPAVSWDAEVIRFYDCHDDAGQRCTVESKTRHYRFAALDSGSLSFLLRATWALSPRLSLQVYGQLFMAQGQFSDYRMVDTTGGEPFIRWSDLRASPFNGDNDGDRVKDDDFEQASFNANLVLRWEPWPGSSFYAVYTRAQSAAPNLRGQPPGFRAGGVANGPAEDVVALKMVLYWGR